MTGSDEDNSTFLYTVVWSNDDLFARLEIFAFSDYRGRRPKIPIVTCKNRDF